MIEEDHDDLCCRSRGHLGEYFRNYMFIVRDDDGDLCYDYTNHRVGRMLISETQVDMDGDLDALDIIWEAEEEEEEQDGTDIF